MEKYNKQFFEDASLELKHECEARKAARKNLKLLEEQQREELVAIEREIVNLIAKKSQLKINLRHTQYLT